MSNYTQTTDFSAKDALATGDPNKKIQGADVDTELDAISTAIASKADTAGNANTGSHSFAGDVTFSDTVQGPFITKNVIAAHNNLVITRTSATVIRVQADELLLEDTSGNIYKASSVDENITITTSGISGLDATDTEGADTWYYLFILYNGTNVNGFMSDSLTPTFPSGYTYSAYVGVARNDSSSDLLNFRQTGITTKLDLPIVDISDGSTGTSANTDTLTVPPNIIAISNARIVDSDAVNALLTETWQTDTAASSSAYTFRKDSLPNSETVSISDLRVNASSQIRYRLDANTSFTMATLGWIFE